MRPRLKPSGRRGPSPGAWLVYVFGRMLQVIGLLVTGVAMTAFFGTPSTTAMLKLMLVGALIFLPGWLLARKGPDQG